MPTTLWKVTCEEHRYPGLWQHWFRSQCVAVGWPPKAGWRLDGKARNDQGWARAKSSLRQMKQGDRVLVALQGNRVARIGTILSLQVDDEFWNPFVPPGPGSRYGEKGRRIEVKWDLELGPDDRELVVELPPNRRLSPGELRPTIARVRSQSLRDISAAMADPVHWAPLWANFDYERALSGYIAAYPHRLEDKLLPFPNERLRERMFKDGTRADVLLVDKGGTPVVVECKQGPPAPEDVLQLRHYLRRVRKEIGREPRGILVHGGSRKLRNDVRRLAASRPKIQMVQYKLEVGFSRSE